MAACWDEISASMLVRGLASPARIMQLAGDGRRATGVARRSRCRRWVARYWDNIATSLYSCPYSNPNDIRQWLRDQERTAKGLIYRWESGA
jgi:hypothetical protein